MPWAHREVSAFGHGSFTLAVPGTAFVGVLEFTVAAVSDTARLEFRHELSVLDL